MVSPFLTCSGLEYEVCSAESGWNAEQRRMRDMCRKAASAPDVTLCLSAQQNKANYLYCGITLTFTWILELGVDGVMGVELLDGRFTSTLAVPHFGWLFALQHEIHKAS